MTQTIYTFVMSKLLLLKYLLELSTGVFSPVHPSHNCFFTSKKIEHRNTFFESLLRTYFNYFTI